jgi:hypothetical protein
LYGFLAGLFIRFPNVNIQLLPLEAQREIEQFVLSPVFIPSLVGILILFLLVGLLVSLLKAFGRSGLVKLIDQVEVGVTPTAQAGWSAAKRYGWRLFFISLLLGLPGFVLILFSILPLLVLSPVLLLGFVNIESNSLPWPALLGLLSAWIIPFCCVGIIVGVFFGLIKILAERVCVIENRTVWESIRNGWKLLREQSGSVLVMWLILTLINAGLVIFFFIPMFGLIFVLLAPLLAMLKIVPASLPLFVISVYFIDIVIIWIYWTATTSVTESFFSSCWTLAYRQWRGSG